jgi:hypothetical protein
LLGLSWPLRSSPHRSLLSTPLLSDGLSSQILSS